MKYIAADWPAPPGINAYTTTRHGWGELAPKSADARQKLHALLPLPTDPIWLNQTHGTNVVAAAPENLDADADASHSAISGNVCLVLTADCLPLLLCNKQGTHIAAIHAGWRGLANGVIESTLRAMSQPAEDLLVWLGPAIGPDKFEVGKDVYDAFVNRDTTSQKAFVSSGDQKWLANLYELARIRLQTAGVKKIYGGNHCTYSEPELFYSYRRDKGLTGRMASLIWRGND